MPASLQTFSEVEVEYEELPGWTEDISKVRRFEDLPAACRTYILRIEEVGLCVCACVCLFVIVNVYVVHVEYPSVCFMSVCYCICLWLCCSS